jgi:hypothetical protein
MKVYLRQQKEFLPFPAYFISSQIVVIRIKDFFLTREVNHMDCPLPSSLFHLDSFMFHDFYVHHMKPHMEYIKIMKQKIVWME